MMTIGELRHQIDRGLTDRRAASLAGRKVTPIIDRVAGDILRFLEERGRVFALDNTYMYVSTVVESARFGSIIELDFESYEPWPQKLYDVLSTLDYTDAIREMNGRTKIASTPLDESLARAQARRTAADADLKELDRAERLAQIAPLDRVKQACAEFSQTLARVIDRRPSRVDEIIAANSRGGLQAARVVEKDERRELRAEMARAMDALADAAVGDGPAIDDLDHQDEALEGRAAPA